MIIRYEELAHARRLPVPRASWLQTVLRADGEVGFDGDGDPMMASVLWGKFCQLYVYSTRLRQHAVEKIMMEDFTGRPMKPKGGQPSRDARLEEGEFAI